MSLRILLVDDHKILRAGLRALIEKEKDLEVVAETEDGHRAVELALDLSPDVIIMDISMSKLNGIDATRQITAACPDVKVLALSMHSDEHFVAGMLAAGASGYLLKDCAVEELSLAIRTAVGGNTYLSPPISKVVIKEYVSRLSKGALSPSSVLTTKEREILQLLAEGKTSKQIASSLNLSARTVEAHRREMMDKLDIHSVAELTKYAVRKGITDLE
jgi:two-component system, NarL family, response regulator NreC